MSSRTTNHYFQQPVFAYFFSSSSSFSSPGEESHLCKCLNVCQVSVHAEIMCQFWTGLQFPPLTPDFLSSKQFAVCLGVFCVLQGFEVVTVTHNFEPCSTEKRRKIFALAQWLALMDPVPVKSVKYLPKYSLHLQRSTLLPLDSQYFLSYTFLDLPILTSYTDSQFERSIKFYKIIRGDRLLLSNHLTI